ncbi:polymorphic toxin-type HINT domain-containing protein [Micromonospora matsumotoense]
MADGSSKPISDVRVGDKVLATDPETGETSARPVTHTWIHEDGLRELKVGGATVATTEDHPFWVASEKRWLGAGKIKRGQKLSSTGGREVATEGVVVAPVRLDHSYNLTVGEVHTYYVLAGNTPALVHNSGPCKPALVSSGVSSLRDGAHMSTDDALDTAIEFVGPGYKDMGGGRFLSRDGLRQVRMTDADLAHPRQNPHMNFETYGNPSGPGVRSGGPVSNIHIYLPEEPGWHTP